MRPPVRKIIRPTSKPIPPDIPPKKDSKANYYTYLESEIWIKIREQILIRDQKRCRLCDSGKSLRVHHRRYPKVYGEEPFEDLITLCSKCHDIFHASTGLTQTNGKKTNKKGIKKSKKQRRRERAKNELNALIKKQSDDILSESRTRWGI